MLSVGLVLISALFSSCYAETDTFLTGRLDKEIVIPCNVPDLTSYQSIRWEDYTHNTNRSRAIIAVDDNVNPEHPRSPDYSVTSDSSLRIGQLKDIDSGYYYCVGVKENGDRVEHSYDLAIIQLPHCEGENYLTEDQRETFTCEFTFKGKLPEVSFMLGAQTLISMDKTELGHAKKEVELVAHPDHNGKTLACLMKTADFEEKCDMVLHVTYRVQNVSLTPAVSDAHVDEMIICKAKGNPLPTITVEGVDEELLKKEEDQVSFQVPKEWQGTQKTISCQAENTVDGETYEESSTLTYDILALDPSDMPPVSSTSSSSRPAPKPTEPPQQTGPGASSAGANIVAIAAGVIIGVVILIIIIIIVVCVARRSNRNKDSGYKAASSGDPDGGRDGVKA